jgi:ABC-type methionine transport system ATPase subunit
MDEGSIVEENTPADFFEHPRSDRTKLFLSKILHATQSVPSQKESAGSEVVEIK